MKDSIPCLSRLLAVVLLVAINGTACFAECVAVGAIRWDAWYGGEKGTVGKAVEQALSRDEFRSRSPFCSRLAEKGKVEMNCATPSAIEQEIDYAVLAGLDYWAFLTYPESDTMSLSLKRYLESSKKAKVKFSIILTPTSLTQPPGSQTSNMERFAGYVQLPNYQRVMGARPLVYFFPAGDMLSNPDKVVWLKKTIADFRALVKSKGGGDPYIVLMDFNPLRNQQISKGLGIDALSTYATHGNERGASYRVLSEETKSFWRRAQSTGLPVVPTVMAGWDPRPRALTPVGGDDGGKGSKGGVAYYLQPTPQELAYHVEEAVLWVISNRKSAEANTVLIYAWNENDEGGWLVPTMGDGDARIKSLGRQTRKQCPSKY